MSDTDDLTGLNLANGSYEEAQEWIGQSSDARYASEPVNRSMIRFYASLVEDPNPVYWDERSANKYWGDIVSPPGMLMSWKMSPPWVPAYYHDYSDVLYATDVPLPAKMDTLINVKTESTFHRPMLEGDCLNWQETIIDVTDKKETRLGVGHFVSSKSKFRTQRGELVAENVNTLFRYAAPEPKTVTDDINFADSRRASDIGEQHTERDATTSRSIDDISIGDTLTPFEFDITYRKVVHNVAATRDFFPGHHDPEYARMQGNETIYLNTMAFHGLVDRLALGWAGPEWQVAERTIEMGGSAQAGDTVEMRGEVTNVSDHTVEIDAGVYLDDSSVCSASLSITDEFQT